MKITYFNYLYDLYGASIGSTIKAIELFAALENSGSEVHMHWRKEHENDGTTGTQKYRKFLKKHLDKFLHEPNQLLRNVKYLWEEFLIISHEKPDLLIARLETNIFSPWLLAHYFKLPYIAEVDSPVTYEMRYFAKNYYVPFGLLERMELNFIMRADKAFCVSSQLKKYFVQRGIPENHIQIIPNGVDINRFHPDVPCQSIREKLRLENQTVIGFIGSFHYWHGVEQLIDLMDGILNSHDSVAFLLLGKGGPMDQRMKEYIQKQKERGSIHLVEHVPHDDVPAMINVMDIVLAPYPNLPFFYYSPVKMYEYMACGKPVVTSRIGQITEVIDHEKNGILCQPGNIEEFQDSVNTLIRDPKLRIKIGEAAFQLIRKRHTWHHRALLLDALCQQVLDSRKTIVST
jgi:glycosyltransferase involved in cell wall biosynthesis